ncbi:hypothetical protein DL98DRAFT_579183 [Cadophora sp. DSE1049]|nr:hypothetical protein DL98DRAFT_579183 [Cadophora sp. DSE1049]
MTEARDSRRQPSTSSTESTSSNRIGNNFFLSRTRPVVWLGAVVASARSNNWDTDLDEEELPEILARYQRYGSTEALEIFKRVLEAEEEKMSVGEKALSDLVRRSEDSGAMWLHMMLSDEKWDQLEEPFFETEEMDKFTEQKMAEKEQYEQDLERTKADMADVDNQKMTAEAFVATL